MTERVTPRNMFASLNASKKKKDKTTTKVENTSSFKASKSHAIQVATPTGAWGSDDDDSVIDDGFQKPTKIFTHATTAKTSTEPVISAESDQQFVSDEEEEEEEEEVSESESQSEDNEERCESERQTNETRIEKEQNKTALSKKKLKQKELEELNALLNDFAVSTPSTTEKETKENKKLSSTENMNIQKKTEVELAAEALLAELIPSSSTTTTATTTTNEVSGNKGKKKNKNKKKKVVSDSTTTITTEGTHAGNGVAVNVSEEVSEIIKQNQVNKKKKKNIQTAVNGKEVAEAEAKVRAEKLKAAKKKDKSKYNQIPNHLM